MRALALIAALATGAAAQEPAPLPRVAVDTSAGRFVVEADTVRAPITANNFLRYVDGHRLDGVRVYRVVRAAPRFGFVQFGVNGDPKRSLPPIAHEPTSRTGLRHLDGTISIARFAPGSARGDFTISVGDQPSLDAGSGQPVDNLGYAAFGRVVEGMEVVERILDTPIAPDATVNGAFKGQVPADTITVTRATRLP